jgi:hypothetical protein
VHFFVLQGLTGPTPSRFQFIGALLALAISDPISNRTKAKLSNGQIQVAGDQWPILLYANYTYDPEDPWNGLLRSGLLVSVSIELDMTYFIMSNELLPRLVGIQTYFYISKLC